MDAHRGGLKQDPLRKLSKYLLIKMQFKKDNRT